MAIKILYEKKRRNPYTRNLPGPQHFQYFAYIYSTAAEYFGCNKTTVYRATDDIEGHEKEILDNPQSRNEVGQWVRVLRKFYLQKYPDLIPREELVKDKMPIQFWAALLELTDEGVSRPDLIEKVAKKCCFHANDIFFVLRRYLRKADSDYGNHKWLPKHEFDNLDRKEVDEWKVKIFEMIGCYDYARVLEKQLGLSGQTQAKKRKIPDRVTLDDVVPTSNN